MTLIIPGPGGGRGGACRVAPDADDALVWLLDESASPFVNSGSGGTADLVVTATASGPLFDAPALFGDSAMFPTRTERHFAAGAKLVNPGSGGDEISVSGWFRFTRFQGAGAGIRHFITKHYRDDLTWAAPFTTVDLRINNAVLQCGVTTGTTGAGARTQLDSEAIYFVGTSAPPWVWHHAAFTYDGANMRLYFNGNLVASAAKTGNLDYNTGGGGDWCVGANKATATTADGAESWLHDVRVATIARSAAHWAEVWKGGAGLLS